MVKAPPLPSDPLPPSQLGQFVVVRYENLETETVAYFAEDYDAALSLQDHYGHLGQGNYAIAELVDPNPGLLVRFLLWVIKQLGK